MPEPFRSLASIFAADGAADAGRLPVPAPRAESRERAAAPPPPADERVMDLLASFTADLARLRARAAERFEECAEAMLTDLARRVLGRELMTARPDIDALLAAALDELDVRSGIVVRVCPEDAERLGARWPVSAQAGLIPGDFAVEVDDGRYDAALQTRLEAMLAAHRVTL